MMDREELEEFIEALREEAIENDDPDALAEAEAFAVIALAWLDATARADTLVAEAVEDPEPETLNAGLAAVLGAGLAAAVAGGLWRVIRAAYGDARRTAFEPPGGDSIPGEPVLEAPPPFTARTAFGLVDERAIGWLHENGLYYVRGFYDARLSERVQALAERAVREGLSPDDAGALFARELGPMYGEGLAYWRLHASAVTTRAREFGRISAYEASGREEVYWTAVKDRRTSAQCDYLHGRPIDVAAMVVTRDAVIAAETPEAQKRAAPWMTEAELREVVEANGGRIPEGVLPPIHGNCRSRTVTMTPFGADPEVVALYRQRVAA